MSDFSTHRWLVLATASVLCLSACGDAARSASAASPAATATVVAAAAATPHAAPTITVQPLSTAVTAGATATFMVSATGEALSYQWQRNGEAVPNATGPSYTTPAASTTDSGVKITVLVSNPDGKVTSQPATLTVSESGFSN